MSSSLARNGSRPFVDAGQHHVRPLQALGGVQRRQRDHVLLVAALGQADDHADGLRHLQHALASRSRSAAAVLGDLAAAAAAIQSTKSSTLPQRAAASFSLSSPSYRCCS
jgi:hypothetical protein